jgi:hypothetical protein
MATEKTTEWQRIDGQTPKDTFILCYFPETEAIGLVKWQAGGWFGVDDLGLTVQDRNASHWMPLPRAPVRSMSNNQTTLRRVLVCGGRDFTNINLLYDTLDKFLGPIDLLISGGACGADSLAEMWADERHVLVERYEADWSAHGKSAGPIRNQRMLHEGKPDVVLAFPGGRGTADMVDRARRAGIRVIEVRA